MALDFLQNLRLRNLFQPDNMIGNDLPSQGGLTGGMSPSMPPMMTPNSADPNSGVGAGDINSGTPALPDIASQMSKLYTPETSATDRLNQLVSNYPQRSNPSMLRKIAAGLTAWQHGMPAGEAVINNAGGFSDKLEEWKNLLPPAEKAAEIERQSNVNERTMAYQTIANELRQQAEEAKARNDAKNTQIRQQRADVYEFKARNPNLKFDFSGPTVKVADPVTGQVKDTGMATGSLSDADKMALGYQEKLGEIRATGEQARQTEGVKAQTKGWNIGTIPDPNDATKSIGVRINQDTGEVQPIKLDGQGIGPFTKPGTAKSAMDQLTTSTRTMMEGAQMLMPHSKDLRAQAIELNKRNLFGPIMSRVRDYAAKIGTTGSPEQVQQSLNDFNEAIASDPLISQSNDRAVGQFITNLGLMTSGMGRVHGGARGGASIQMVNYLKSLLTSSSTLDMFQGRLDTLDDYLKGYAQGPAPPNSTQVPQDKLNKAIDDIFKAPAKK